MSDIAGIAGNAVAVYQQALTTVSNNIANVSTEGYSRQDVALSALPVTKAGSVFLGSGVGMDRVKRQYDQFVESNLRNTTSDLAAQGPVVDYANRIVDVMGSESMGLNTALDAFFSSARNLSADPSSTVLRSSFVRDASGVADRFGQLSTQLDLVQDQTQEELDSAIGQINMLSAQIAKVNAQLSNKKSEDAQPPDLLDQRDLLLKKLADFMRVNTRFEANGQVTVSAGPTITQDVLVANQKSFTIGANYNAAAPEKVALVLDPYGSPQPLSGITSGSIAGLMTFREQVLGNTRNSLDSLARTFASEVNNMHRQGIDGYGNPGQDLLKFDTSVTTAAGGIRVAFSDPMLVAAASQFRVIEGPDNPSGTDATLTYVDPMAPQPPGTPPKAPPGPGPIQNVFANNDHVSAAKPITVSSTLPITAVTTLQQGMADVSIYLNTMQPGQQLQVMTQDGRQLIGSKIDDQSLRDNTLTTGNGFAAGATYEDRYLNQSGAAGYKGMTVFYGAQASAQVQPVYNPDGTVSSTKTNNFPALLQGDRITAIGIPALAAPVVNAGTVFSVGNVVQSGNTIQIAAANLTLAGNNSKTLSINGFAVTVSSATSAQAIATAVNSTSGLAPNTVANVATDGSLVITTAPKVLFPAGSFNVNGVALGELNYPVDGTNVKPSAIAAWVNTKTALTGVTASASNTIVVDAAQVKFGLPLYINGAAVNTSTAVTLTDLASAINNSTAGVSARVNADGKLVISNGGERKGDEITIAGNTVSGSIAQNALGLGTGVYRGSISLSQPVADAATYPVGQLSLTSPLFINGTDVKFTDGNGPSALGSVNLSYPGATNQSFSVSALNFTRPLGINGVQISEGSGAGGPTDGAALVIAINARRGQSNVKAELSGDQLILSRYVSTNPSGIDISRGPLELVNAINASSSQSNVQARLSSDKSNLILSNVPGAQGATITVSRAPLVPGSRPGTYILQDGANALSTTNGALIGPEVPNLAAVQLGFGTGTPADLLKMGFRTGAFIKGPVKDDLLVFVSGTGAAMVSASYAGKPADARQSLRANPMTVTFTDATHYQIVDNNTGTIVAERVLDPLQLSPAIRYQGLSLSFTAAPKANDTFTMDGNKDGVGNNDNMLAISALETKAVVGKETLSNAYIDQINEMGNISRQAAISQTALTVVHDQAVKSRDTISGVSLDQEAADLIRYQQAYQASAKTLQIAGQLFDTVLHVN